MNGQIKTYFLMSASILFRICSPTRKKTFSSCFYLMFIYFFAKKMLIFFIIIIILINFAKYGNKLLWID